VAIPVSLIILIAIFLATPAYGAREPGKVFGIWLTEGGNSKLKIFPCGDKACAKVVRLKNPTYTPAKPGRSSHKHREETSICETNIYIISNA
jgi:uncharacterized protein (DUF2147 family)